MRFKMIRTLEIQGIDSRALLEQELLTEPDPIKAVKNVIKKHREQVEQRERP